MPDSHFFPRGISIRGGAFGIRSVGSIATSSGMSVNNTLTLSSGIDFPMSTGPTTGTDLIVGSVHTLITTSDGGYYRLDPPSPAGITTVFLRNGTTATTSYVIPDTTTVTIYTSSGSSEGRLVTISGRAGIEFLALTTAQWIPKVQFGNVACTSST